MTKILYLFVISMILKNAVYGYHVPLPYGFNGEDYADRSLFGNFFKSHAVQGRNDTPNTPTESTTTTTVKPETTTTETIVYIPVIQETIYQPDYPLVPPYPVFYNVPAGINQFDNFGPYQTINNFPPFVPSRLQSFPIQNPFGPDLVSDKIILEPVQPNVKPAKPATVVQNENIDVEITDADRDLLAAKLTELIGDFLTKKQQKLDAEIQSYTEKNPNLYDYYMVPNLISARPSIASNAPIKQTDQIENSARIETVYNFDDKIKQDDINKPTTKQLFSNLLNNCKGTEVTKTTQSAQENQFKWTTPETDIDESRKLDFGEGETTSKEYEKSTSATSTNKLLPIFPEDLIKRLENNLTSANDSKRTDFNGEFVKRPNFRHFVDDRGRKCTEELLILDDHEYYIITCEEKSFDGTFVDEKTTHKSDITYFTEELGLTTPIPEIKSPINLKKNENNIHKTVKNNSTFTSEIYSGTTASDIV